MIPYQEKKRIHQAVLRHIERYGSKNKAANSLKNVSSATLHQIEHEIWDQIADNMWRNVGSQLGISGKNWVIVQTATFERIQQLMSDAQADAKVFGMIGTAGSGKTKALEHYAYNNQEVFYIRCAEYWDRKYFLGEIMRVIGRSTSGMNTSRLMETLVHQLKQRHQPLLIIDEADKLPDHVLCFFITLYNSLEDHCGIVLSATHHLEHRIERGIRFNKKGYQEIYSRLGRKYVEIHPPTSEDVVAICMANGVEHRDYIKQVIDDSKADLRRVNRKVYALKKITEENERVATEALEILNTFIHKKHLKDYDAALELINDTQFDWRGIPHLFEKWNKQKVVADKVKENETCVAT